MNPRWRGADRVDGGGGAGQGRDARDLCIIAVRRTAFVEERLAAERRVDDQLDPVVHEFVADVRAAFVDLEDDLGVDAVRAQVVRGAARGQQGEAQALQIPRDLSRPPACRGC